MSRPRIGREPRVVAMHEAGHAVLAHAAGLQITEASLINGEHYGWLMTEGRVVTKADTWVSQIADAAGSLAGAAAEAIHLGEDVSEITIDDEMPDYRGAVLRVQSHLLVTGTRATPRRYLRLLDEVWTETVRYLQAPTSRAVVARFACLLLRRESLDAEDASDRRAMRTALRDLPPLTRRLRALGTEELQAAQRRTHGARVRKLTA